MEEANNQQWGEAVDSKWVDIQKRVRISSFSFLPHEMPIIFSSFLPYQCSLLHPCTDFHKVVQQPLEREDAQDRKLGDRPGRRSDAVRVTGAHLLQETGGHQQQAQDSSPEAREQWCCPTLLEERGHQACRHWT